MLCQIVCGQPFGLVCEEDSAPKKKKKKKKKKKNKGEENTDAAAVSQSFDGDPLLFI